MSQNPFNQEENIDLWLEKDTEFQKTKKDSFQKYVLKYGLNPNIIMSIKELYLKIVNFITKNVIVATVLMTLVVAGATVTAAEILLPRYKPSSLLQDWFENKIETPVPAEQKSNPFSVNTQSQKDPNQLLVADEQNNVFVYHTCGLIIKYPKKFQNSITQATIATGIDLKYIENVPYDVFGDDVAIYTMPIDKSHGGSVVSVRCSKEKPKSDPFEVKVSKEKLQEVTGWFLTAADIDEVILMENENMPFAYNYSFKYKDLYYSGSFIEKAAGTKEQRMMDYLGGLYSTQVQIQFKDQVPNPPQIPEDRKGIPIDLTTYGQDKKIAESFQEPPNTIIQDPELPIPINLTKLDVSYYNDGDFNDRSGCNNFTRGVSYSTKSYQSADYQSLIAVDSESLIENKFILDGQNSSSLSKAQIKAEFISMLSSDKPITKDQNYISASIFKDCGGYSFSPGTPEELNINKSSNSRSFITQQFPGGLTAVTYAIKGKYLIAMTTGFPRTSDNITDTIEKCTSNEINATEKSKLNCYSGGLNSNDIKLISQTVNKLLKTFELK